MSDLPIARSRPTNSQNITETNTNATEENDAMFSVPLGNQSDYTSILPVAYSTGRGGSLHVSGSLPYASTSSSTGMNTSFRDSHQSTDISSSHDETRRNTDIDSPIRCVCPFCGVLLLIPRGYGLVQCGNCRSLLALRENGVPPMDVLLQSHSFATCYGCNRFILFPSGATSVRCGGCGTVTVLTPRNILSGAHASSMRTSPTVNYRDVADARQDGSRVRGTDISGTVARNTNASVQVATNSLESSAANYSRPTRHCICRKCGIRLLFQGSPQRVQCGRCNAVTTLIEPLPPSSGIIVLENPSSEGTSKLFLAKLIAKGPERKQKAV
eukprot:jgi/Galph1/4183/GphlegSOOS_G2866.1